MCIFQIHTGRMSLADVNIEEFVMAKVRVGAGSWVVVCRVCMLLANGVNIEEFVTAMVCGFVCGGCVVESV